MVCYLWYVTYDSFVLLFFVLFFCVGIGDCRGVFLLVMVLFLSMRLLRIM